jgi:hypothetical protein
MEMYDMKGPPTDLVPAQFPTPFSDQTVPQEVASASARLPNALDVLGTSKTMQSLRLAGVKELLPSYLFGPWIRKEFGMTDETPSGYMAATREIPADPPSGKKSPRPKLTPWDREGQNGARGYADIELPCGVIIYHCAVFGGAQDGPYVEPSFPSHVDWPKAFFGGEFDNDIISQIGEIDPSVFDEECRLRTDMQSKSPA